jgi:N-acetylmuramic acid 6-phosphate etherase
MADQQDPALDARRIGALATEQANPRTTRLDRMSPLEIVRAMNAEDATVAGAVAAEAQPIAEAIAAIAGRLRDGGRLIYLGAGTSGRLGALDAVECPPTFGIAPDRIIGCIAGGSFALDQAAEDFEDDAEAGRADLARLRVAPADAVVGITASGRTPYVLGALAFARERGALTIGLACNRDTRLAREVEISIAPVVGPEALAGSTRLKAGTAQKMVLNMVSTGVMVLLGKTYGNLMVDLRATNAKLQARAVSVLRQVTGLDEAQAITLLGVCGGEVKTAIVAARAGTSPEAARARLAAADGSLRTALEGMA